MTSRPVGTARRAAWADRQRRRRERLDRGAVVIPLELDAERIEWLVLRGRLRRSADEDRAEIARSVLGILDDWISHA